MRNFSDLRPTTNSFYEIRRVIDSVQNGDQAGLVREWIFRIPSEYLRPLYPKFFIHYLNLKWPTSKKGKTEQCKVNNQKDRVSRTFFVSVE